MSDAGTPPERQVPLLGIDLGEMLVFAHWMEQACQAADKGEPLPAAPKLTQGRVRTWVEMMRRVDESIRQAETNRATLKETLAAQADAIGPLASPLCEKLAELYDHLGHPERAQAVRTRVATLYVRPEGTEPESEGSSAEGTQESS